MTLQIVSTSSGHLECRECGMGTFWCKHIEEYINEGSDAKDIWADTDIVDLTGAQLIVPVIPTLGQWATIGFGEAHHGNYAVELLFSDKADSKTGEIPSEFLGFLSPGEGRRVLRSMVLTWFSPREPDVGECQSTSHGFSAQRAWEQETRKANLPGRSRLAQHWSVFTKGMCLTCAAAVEAITGDDLVPDGSPARSPWGRR